MIHMWVNSHNVIISYYHNIKVTWTEIKPFCTLRTQSDSAFNLFFKYGYHAKRSLQQIHVLHMLIILSAFDVKIQN